MTVEKTAFGQTKSGKTAELYTITNKQKMNIAISSFGGAIQKIGIPTARGEVDVVLGYDDVTGYENQTTYIGSILGRVANRIGEGKFTLNGREYNLYKNNGNNHLHGGKVGFDKKIWSVLVEDDDKIKLSYVSPDGEEGYPGELTVSVTYRLVECNTLIVEYKARTTKDTLCNLSNHSYFNLAGYASGSVGKQLVQLFADSYTVFDKESVPHGKIAAVSGTALDLRKPTIIDKGWDADFTPIKNAGGYDQNFVVPEYNGNLKKIAKAYSEKTGISMTVSTTMPGFQFYTANFLDATMTGKNNVPLAKRTGFCLESQYFPNAINVPSFITPILRKGNVYEATTAYHFDVNGCNINK